MKNVWAAVRAFLRLNDPPAVPRGNWTVEGAPIEIGQRVMIDWAANVTGIVATRWDEVEVHLVYPDGTTITATIKGDPRIGASLLDGLQTLRRTQ